jgi:hypothetical protein
VPGPEDVKDASVEKLLKDGGRAVERKRTRIFFARNVEQNAGVALC